jgi:hypothetical protein
VGANDEIKKLESGKVEMGQGTAGKELSADSIHDQRFHEMPW